MHLKRLLLACLAGPLTVSCATMDRSAQIPSTTASGAAEPVLEGPVTQHDLSDAGTDLNAIPLEVNKLVLQWVDYFQGRGRPHMERYLARSGRYAPMMKEVLRREGLPEDLVYIALIESGFSPTARSTANAVGYWQFIRGTGRRYNLEINAYVDERRDFVKATEAAAGYFKTLYGMFGSWYLAIASYNVGEGRVKNLVVRHKTRDFWWMARERKLPQETIHYIPKFTAARMIAKDPARYGFTNVEYQPALTFTEITLNHSVDLRQFSNRLNLDYEEMKALNPAYKRGVAFEKNGVLKLRVPESMAETAVAAASGAVIQTVRSYASTQDDDDHRKYRVRPGDTLGSIARKFRTTVKKLKRLNGMGNRTQIIAGRNIKVPNGNVVVSERKDTTVAVRKGSRTNRATAASAGSRVHIVRKGDTLFDIARQYKVPIRTLAEYNQINRQSKIMVGSRITIPD